LAPHEKQPGTGAAAGRSNDGGSRSAALELIELIVADLDNFKAVARLDANSSPPADRQTSIRRAGDRCPSIEVGFNR
jgi:hypothetical protein